MHKNKMPIIVRILLFLILPYDEMNNLIGDFEELYKTIRKQHGAIISAIIICYQILLSTPGFIKDKIYWGVLMFKNYLLTTFRNIKNQKGYSFINITGLAIGFTCSMLILFYVQYELCYDKHFTNAKQIYRVCDETSFTYQGRNKSTATPAPLAKELVTRYPEVKAATTFDVNNNILVESNEQKFFEDNFVFSDQSILEVFSIELTEGNRNTALADPASMLMSESMAGKYFGSENPIGKVVKVEGTQNFYVTGIFKELPSNTHFTLDFIVPIKAMETLWDTDLTAWYRFGYYTYLLLNEDSNPEVLTSKMQELRTISLAPGKEPNFNYFLQPITDIHLYSDFINEISINGDISSIYMFSLIALFILLIACFNYINLSTSRSVYRAKEIGVRKVIGAQKNQIVRQFLSESLIVTFISAVLAISLIWLILPYFNNLVERNIPFGSLFELSTLIPLIGSIVLIGIAAGFYPSMVMSSFRPASVLGGKMGNKSRGKTLRNIFVVSQFSISVFLIITTLVINAQLSFIKNTDVGYSKEQIVAIKIKDDSIAPSLDAIKSELKLNPNIINAAYSTYLPNNVRSLSRIFKAKDSGDESLGFYNSIFDYDFIDLYGIKIVEGRNFSKNFPTDSVDNYLVNESAVKELGYEHPIGEEFYYGVHGGTRGRARIIGVIKDFNMHSLRQQIEPLYCKLGKSDNYRYLSIKILPANISSTLDYIHSTFAKHTTKYPFEYSFFDEVFNSVYENEAKEELIFTLFASLAIFIACLGLFGLVSFVTVRRTKEIGIRKVLGASIPGLLVMLIRDFIKLVLIANLIAWPVAYYFMSKWLEDFAYRVDMGVGIFILSGVIALAIAGLTVIYQAARAASANPANSLKYE